MDLFEWTHGTSFQFDLKLLPYDVHVRMHYMRYYMYILYLYMDMYLFFTHILGMIMQKAQINPLVAEVAEAE